MDPAKMNELLARMKPEEVRDGLWMIGVFEDWGSMAQAEADEWRRRILARQGCLALSDNPRSPSAPHGVVASSASPQVHTYTPKSCDNPHQRK